MTKTRIFRKLSSSFIIMIATAVIIAALPTGSYAAQKKYSLPASETVYAAPEDAEGNIISSELRKVSTRTYKYDKKGHVTKFVMKSDDCTTTETTKWVYKKGVARKATITSVEKYKDEETGEVDTSRYKSIVKFDKKGRELTGEDLRIIYNKRGWITALSVEECRNKIKNITYYKNGMPKSFSRAVTVMDTDMYKYSLNKKGLVTECSFNSSEPNLISYTYDKKGRVKSKQRKVKIDGEYVVAEKTEYKYAKSTTTDKRIYFGIMNHDVGASLVSASYIPRSLTVLTGAGVF